MHNNKIMLSFANEFQTRLLSLDVKNNKIVTQKTRLPIETLLR